MPSKFTTSGSVALSRMSLLRDPRPASPWNFVLSTGLSEHGIEDFGDHALAGFGECADAFELLLDFRGGAAFAGCLGGGAADQVFDVGVEGLGRGGERGDGDGHTAAFVVRQGWLRDAEDPGEFDLGNVARTDLLHWRVAIAALL